MDKISIIVPCYNEEEALPLFHEEATRVLDGIGLDYEILLINDGSKDQTLRAIKELAAQNKRIKYLSFSRNFGKEAAMYAGFCNVDGDYVAVMDADMQDPPQLLPQMLEILKSNEYDSVATRRVSRTGEPPVRSFFARNFYKLMAKISDAEIVDGARDFRLMRKPMVDAIVSMHEYNRFSKGIFGWIGFRTYWLPYENVDRVAGQSKWSFWGLVRYAVEGIVDFSHMPLNIASWIGFISTALSFLAIIFVVCRRIIFGDPVAGWASLICIIIFMGGIQLMSLGVIGQYIARTYLETKSRPHYIIAESNKDNVKTVN